MEHFATITFVGQMNVGKTALIQRFINNKPVIQYRPTIEDVFNKTISVRDEIYHFRIIDTSGDNQFNVLKEEHYIESDFIVYVYSVNDRSSFLQCEQELRQILSTVIKSGRETIPSIIIVGNKCDLKKQRKVSALEAQNLVSLIETICPCAFFETSAVYDIQVSDLFNIFITGVPEMTVKKINQGISIVNQNVSLLQLSAL